MPPPTMKIIVYILRCETYKSTTRRNEKKKTLTHKYRVKSTNQFTINLRKYTEAKQNQNQNENNKKKGNSQAIEQFWCMIIWMCYAQMPSTRCRFRSNVTVFLLFASISELFTTMYWINKHIFFCSFSLLAICESKSILFMESAPSLFLNEYNFFYFFLFLLGQTPLDVIRNREWVMIAVLWLHFAKNKLDCSYFNYNLSFVMGNLNIILTRIFKYLNMKKKD